MTAPTRRLPEICVASQVRKLAMMIGNLLAMLADLIGSSTYPPGFAANDK
jgi:hypothetical protein